MYKLTLKPRSVEMIQEAYRWYEEQNPGLVELFLIALDAVFDKITLHPEYYHTVKDSYRQVKVHQFPYVIVFEFFKNEVVIYAVFHTFRDPNKKWED